MAVGDDVGEINVHNTEYKDNCGETTNEDEDRIVDDIAKEEEEEEEEEEYEKEENHRRDEREDIMEDEGEGEEQEQEVKEENDQRDEVNDAHLEEEIHGNVSNKNGDEKDVGKGNRHGIVKELTVDQEEDVEIHCRHLHSPQLLKKSYHHRKLLHSSQLFSAIHT